MNQIVEEDILIQLKEVLSVLGISRATLYRRIKEKKIAGPVKDGNISLWPLSEIRGYKEKLVSSRG